MIDFTFSRHDLLRRIDGTPIAEIALVGENRADGEQTTTQGIIFDVYSLDRLIRQLENIRDDLSQHSIPPIIPHVDIIS